MIARRLFAALLAAAATTMDLAHAKEEPVGPFNWSERGLFVFDEYVLDFHRGVAAPNGAHSVNRLRNCSTAEFRCADSWPIALVLPQRCDQVSVGDSWTVGEITTRVIAQYERPSTAHLDLPGARPVVSLLATDGRNFVYFFEPRRGVYGIAWGWPWREPPLPGEAGSLSRRSL